MKPPAVPVNPDAQRAIEQWLEWVHTVSPDRWLFAERRVYSRDHQYVGTADAGYEKDNKLYLADWKTSSGIRLDYLMQLASYAKAIEEEDGVAFDAIVCVRIPKDGDPVEVVERTDIDDLFEQFLRAKSLHLFGEVEGA